MFSPPSFWHIPFSLPPKAPLPDNVDAWKDAKKTTERQGDNSQAATAGREDSEHEGPHKHARPHLPN